VRAYANGLLDGEGRERGVDRARRRQRRAAGRHHADPARPAGSEIGTPGFERDRGDAWRLWNLAPPNTPRSVAPAAASVDAASWPTTSWSATPSSTASSTSTPAPANRPRSLKTRPTAATKPPQITLRFGRESTWADCEAAVSTLADHASDSRGAGFQNGRRIECGPYRESVTPARTGTSAIASGRAAVRTMKWTRTFFRTSFGNQLWLKDLESTEAEATVRRPGPPEGRLPLYDGLAGRVD